MLAGVTGSSIEQYCEKLVANLAGVHISAKVCAVAYSVFFCSLFSMAVEG